MKEYSKGAVNLNPAVCPPMSLHEKNLPGGDSAPSPQSFHNDKAGANGGDLRVGGGLRADEVMRGVGG